MEDTDMKKEERSMKNMNLNRILQQVKRKRRVAMIIFLKKVFCFIFIITLCTIITGYTVRAEDIENIKPEYKISKEEINMMECVIQKEVRDGSLKHKTIVAQLIINRLNSDDFPNTIKKVLEQKDQFVSIDNYYITKYEPDNNTKKAVKRVVDGYKDVSFGAVFYFSPIYCADNKTKEWFRSLTHCLTYSEKLYSTKYTHEFYK